MPVIEAVGVLALGWLLRHRNRLTVVIACGAMAVYPVCLIDQRTVMLEPFCATLCLLGLAAVFEGDRLSRRPGRLAVAGVFFGLAGSCKAFAVLPFAVVALALLVSPARRRLTPFLAGTVGAFAAVCGPFFVLAPGAFLNQVIVTQLTRADKVGPSVYNRLVSLVGSPPSVVPPPIPDHGQRTLAVLLALAIGVLVAGSYAVGHLTVVRHTVVRHHGGAHDGRGARLTSLDAVGVLTVVVTGTALAEPPAYYYHYAAFFGPFLALMLGLAAGRISPHAPVVLGVCTAAVLLAGAVHAVQTVRASRGGYPDVSLIDRLVPAGACVLGDDAPTLILADRFSSTAPGCTAVTDAFGTTISSDGGYIADSSAATKPKTVGVWLNALEHSDYVVLVLGYQERRIPWQAPALVHYVDKDFHKLQAVGYIILGAQSANGSDRAGDRSDSARPWPDRPCRRSRRRAPATRRAGRGRRAGTTSWMSAVSGRQWPRICPVRSGPRGALPLPPEPRHTRSVVARGQGDVGRPSLRPGTKWRTLPTSGFGRDRRSGERRTTSNDWSYDQLGARRWPFRRSPHHRGPRHFDPLHFEQ